MLSNSIVFLNKTISELAANDIHGYATKKSLMLEKHMARYFEREYQRWHGNYNHPESYGISSFSGDIASNEIADNSINHYNKNIRVYKAFLDNEYLAYSMAYYGALNDKPEINNDLALEQAQEEKYKLIIKRADIKDGHNVLDLGCGYGGLAKYLLRIFPNITITGVNPSTIQSEYINEELHLDNTRFNLLQQYYGGNSHETIAANSFDRVVSIGSLEHITNLDSLFENLKHILKPGGKCLHHLIVSTYTIPQLLDADNTLISDYFPSGHIWPFHELKRHNTHLSFKQSWFINGMNYWKTLDEWHRRFWASIEQLYPEHLSIDEVEYWNKYFILCKSMFSPNQGRSYGNGQYLYEKI